MPKAFFDTNVLAYASDGDSPRKQSVARAVLKQHATNTSGCLSTQVLQEFYVTAVKKLSIAPLDAKDIIQSFLRFEVVTIDPEDIQRAIDATIIWQISFWDSLILVAARKARCDVLLSEDLNHGQLCDGVRIVNPFLP